MFKILTLLGFFGARLILAATYEPLDSCVHLTGPYVYQQFDDTVTVDGVTSFEFYVMSEKSPHILINAEPNQTSDYYEIVFYPTGGELRRRRYGQSYLVLNNGNRDNLLSTYKPLPVKIVTKLEGARRRLDVFIHGEETPFMTGYDDSPIETKYYSLTSWIVDSQYWHKCSEPEQDCSQVESLNDSNQLEINRLEAILRVLLQTGGYSTSSIDQLLKDFRTEGIDNRRTQVVFNWTARILNGVFRLRNYIL